MSAHLIQQFRIELSVASRAQAKEAQERLASCRGETLDAALDTCLSRFAREEVLCIDTLELDLGRLRYAELEDDFATRLLTRLHDALARQVVSADGGLPRAAAADRAPTTLSLAARELRQLVGFLEQGTLHWSATETAADPAAMLERAMREQPEEVARRLRQLVRRPTVRRRLAAQFAPASLAQLAALLEPAHGARLARLVDALDQMQRRFPLVKVAQGDFRRVLWEEALALFAASGVDALTATTGPALLQALARRYRLLPTDLATLLAARASSGELAECAKGMLAEQLRARSPGATSGTPSATALQPESGRGERSRDRSSVRQVSSAQMPHDAASFETAANETAASAATSRRDDIAQLVQLFLKGDLSWATRDWLGADSVDRLRAVLREDAQPLITALRPLAERPDAIDRLLRYLPWDALSELVLALAPVCGGYVVTYLMAADRVAAGRGVATTSPGDLRAIAWRVVLASLLDAQASALRPHHFTAEVSHRIARRLSVSTATYLQALHAAAQGAARFVPLREILAAHIADTAPGTAPPGEARAGSTAPPLAQVLERNAPDIARLLDLLRAALATEGGEDALAIVRRLLAGEGITAAAGTPGASPVERMGNAAPDSRAQGNTAQGSGRAGDRAATADSPAESVLHPGLSAQAFAQTSSLPSLAWLEDAERRAPQALRTLLRALFAQPPVRRRLLDGLPMAAFATLVRVTLARQSAAVLALLDELASLLQHALPSVDQQRWRRAAQEALLAASARQGAGELHLATFGAALLRGTAAEEGMTPARLLTAARANLAARAVPTSPALRDVLAALDAGGSANGADRDGVAGATAHSSPAPTASRIDAAPTPPPAPTFDFARAPVAPSPTADGNDDPVQLVQFLLQYGSLPPASTMSHAQLETWLQTTLRTALHDAAAPLVALLRTAAAQPLVRARMAAVFSRASREAIVQALGGKPAATLLTRLDELLPLVIVSAPSSPAASITMQDYAALAFEQLVAALAGGGRVPGAGVVLRAYLDSIAAAQQRPYAELLGALLAAQRGTRARRSGAPLTRLLRRLHARARAATPLVPGSAARANAPVAREDPSAPSELRELPAGEPCYIANAGLVLLWPFLSRYFGLLELLTDGAFNDAASAERAVLLLEHLATGSSAAPEHRLLLNKLLCGVRPELPVARSIELDQREISVSQELLHGVTQNWPQLRNTSIEGLRETFLCRDGRLLRNDDGWTLSVGHRPYDMLLDSLPWSLTPVRLGWMKQVLHVQWR